VAESIDSVVQTMAELFAGRSREEQKRLLAALERAGAAVYRALAQDEADASAREALLAAALREEENASALEAQA
jgi:putative heme degradation protein